MSRRCPHRSPASEDRGPTTRHRATDRPLMGFPSSKVLICRSSSALVGPRAPRVVHSHGPRASRPAVSRCLSDQVIPSATRPSRVPRVLPAGRPLGRLRLPEVSLPFDDVTRPGPVCDGPSGSATVPLPGFLTPSAASWLDRACDLLLVGRCRPGFSPFRAFPSRGSRAPRRGRWLPCRSFRPDLGAARAALSLRVSPTTADVRASTVAGSPPELGAPFQRHSLRSTTSRSPWTSHAGLTSSRSSRRLRSVDLHRESVHVPQRSPAARRPVLSWAFSAPPEPCSRHDLGSCHPPRRRRPSCRDTRTSNRTRRTTFGTSSRAPLAAHATSAFAGDPRRRVGSNVDDRIVPSDPSAVTRALRSGPCHPSAATSTPMTFHVAANRDPPRVTQWW